jgi:hypothetical protein
MCLYLKSVGFCSAFFAEVERGCQFPAFGWNRINRREAQQSFFAP